MASEHFCADRRSVLAIDESTDVLAVKGASFAPAAGAMLASKRQPLATRGLAR